MKSNFLHPASLSYPRELSWTFKGNIDDLYSQVVCLLHAYYHVTNVPHSECTWSAYTPCPTVTCKVITLLHQTGPAGSPAVLWLAAAGQPNQLISSRKQTCRISYNFPYGFVLVICIIYALCVYKEENQLWVVEWVHSPEAFQISARHSPMHG